MLIAVYGTWDDVLMVAVGAATTLGIVLLWGLARAVRQDQQQQQQQQPPCKE